MSSVISEASFVGWWAAGAGVSVPSCRAWNRGACYPGAQAWRGWEGGRGGRRGVMHCGGAMLVVAVLRVVVLTAALPGGDGGGGSGAARRRRGVTPRRSAWLSSPAGQTRCFVLIFSTVRYSV